MEAILPVSPSKSGLLLSRWGLIAGAGGVVALASILAAWVHGLSHVSLSIPLNPFGDAATVLAMVKGMMEHGSFMSNPSLGAPYGQELYDFPNCDLLHFALLKLISLFAPNAAWAVNVFYLACYPLTALIALLVLLGFGVSIPSAAFASILYAFLPYHLLRNEGHLMLGAYYMVPLSVGFALSLFEGRRWTRRRTWLAAFSCLLIASSGIYYAFFGCFFVGVAGLLASAERRDWAPLRRAAILVAATCAGVLANLAPSFLYWLRNGRNHAVANRSFADAEVHGLKLAQLILPTNPHPIHLFARIRAKYATFAPLVAENDWVALGAVGTLGFLLLLALLFRRSSGKTGERLSQLSRLNLAALLLAQIGGFGVVFNLLVNPTIRAYNRICVFIAFFSLFAAALLLDRARERLAASPRGRLLFGSGLAALLLLAVADQTGPMFEVAAGQRIYSQDEAFVQQLESRMPEDSRIYELPYVAFPEGAPAFHEGSYDLIQPYLHSRTLRWSYATMTGREGARWNQATAALAPAQLLAELRSRGFAGILIDRQAYPDQGAALQKELTQLLGTAPLIGGAGERFVFFEIRT